MEFPDWVQIKEKTLYVRSNTLFIKIFKISLFLLSFFRSGENVKIFSLR